MEQISKTVLERMLTIRLSYRTGAIRNRKSRSKEAKITVKKGQNHGQKDQNHGQKKTKSRSKGPKLRSKGPKSRSKGAKITADVYKNRKIHSEFTASVNGRAVSDERFSLRK